MARSTRPTQTQSPEGEEERSLWRASGLGIELAGSIGGMAVVGWLIDRWVGTSPMWLLILLGVGTVGGTYNFVRQAMALNRKASEAYRQKRAARGPDTPSPRAPSGAHGEGMFPRTEATWDDDDDAAPPGFKPRNGPGNADSGGSGA
jgi:F0F1-type ATP synthase assembly protein I